MKTSLLEMLRFMVRQAEKPLLKVPGSEPEAQVLEALGEEELTQRILALREPYKTPCRLMLLEQHTAAEAARLCGRPQKTVEAQVFRAKKMLAAQLSAAGKEGF